jgi:hypothetical protein
MRASIERLEDVSLIVLDFVLLEKPKVFVTKAPPGMAPFLVADVVNYAGELRMAVRKGPESFLPTETSGHPALSIDDP